MGEAAVRVAQSVSYANAGTVEFLLDDQNQFYFLEMNTRLQVEHPVTEMVTGIDLVKQQLRVAQGEPLGISQDDVRMSGHAIECRVYAEDPSKKFAPSPGLIRYLMLPEGPGIRNDNGVYSGFTVPLFYDPMLSKLIAHGATREEAIERMRRALNEYRVEGIRTTIPFYLRLMDSAEYRAADFDTGFIDRLLPTLGLEVTEERHVEAAIIAAAIFAFEESQNIRIPLESDSRWRRAGRSEGVTGGGR